MVYEFYIYLSNVIRSKVIHSVFCLYTSTVNLINYNKIVLCLIRNIPSHLEIKSPILSGKNNGLLAKRWTAAEEHTVRISNVMPFWIHMLYSCFAWFATNAKKVKSSIFLAFRRAVTNSIERFRLDDETNITWSSGPNHRIGPDTKPI
jgi:hypothetical protein